MDSFVATYRYEPALSQLLIHTRKRMKGKMWGLLPPVRTKRNAAVFMRGRHHNQEWRTEGSFPKETKVT